MSFLFQISTLTGFLHWGIVLGVMIRVVMKRPATGVALAWLLIVSLLPAIGIVLYVLIGERRIGGSRAQRIASLRTSYQEISEIAVRDLLTNVDWSKHPAIARGMAHLGRSMVGSLTVCGSQLELLSDSDTILKRMAEDIDSARTSLLIEFYIWNEGGLADDVLEALIRAAKRGVHCRLLVDAIGGRPWWKGPQPRRLQEAGVYLRPALPVAVVPILGGRSDLRLHRKIVIVDGEIAWTGSMNLVDPSCFKQNSGVGKWIDAMVRVRGAVVAPLAATMIGDWMLETGEPIHDLIKDAGLSLIKPDGPADIQVVPSGPGETADGLLQLMLALINSAEKELILTTPYFVPDESLLRAVRGAAGRGVKVALIVPEKVDSVLTRFASRSYYDDLLEVGVEIYLFRGGLLHTKSIVVDRATSMFGTVNLDMRSLWLNYEVSLFVFDREFAESLSALQQCYIRESIRLDATTWKARPFQHRLLENTLRLVSPLL